MKGEIELYNISFLILKVELHFKQWILCPFFKKLKLSLKQFASSSKTFCLLSIEYSARSFQNSKLTLKQFASSSKTFCFIKQ